MGTFAFPTRWAVSWVAVASDDRITFEVADGKVLPHNGKKNPTESDLKNDRAPNSRLVLLMRKNGHAFDDGLLGYDAREVQGDGGIREVTRSFAQKI